MQPLHPARAGGLNAERGRPAPSRFLEPLSGAVPQDLLLNDLDGFRDPGCFQNFGTIWFSTTEVGDCNQVQAIRDEPDLSPRCFPRPENDAAKVSTGTRSTRTFIKPSPVLVDLRESQHLHQVLPGWPGRITPLIGG